MEKFPENTGGQSLKIIVHFTVVKISSQIYSRLRRIPIRRVIPSSLIYIPFLSSLHVGKTRLVDLGGNFIILYEHKRTFFFPTTFMGPLDGRTFCIFVAEAQLED